MEEDRLETNLGLTADQEIVPEPETITKQPKRRFVGRKAAEAQKAASGKVDDIESSTAIQGDFRVEYSRNGD
jgi:2-(3-amino-3-carboxypropyl)histidine synthase